MKNPNHPKKGQQTKVNAFENYYFLKI